MAKLKITQVRSEIGGKQKQRDSLRSLGLGRVGASVVRDDRPEVRGQISIVAHLVSIEEVSE